MYLPFGGLDKAKVSAGPRVFAVNLLVLNLAYALFFFFYDLAYVSTEYAEFTSDHYGKSTKTSPYGLGWGRIGIGLGTRCFL